MKTKWRNLKIVFLTAIAMFFCVLAISPSGAFASEPDVEITEVSTWNGLLNAVNSDKAYVKLMNSIEDHVPDDELPTKHRLLFNGGIDYVLDLNGYELKVLNHINEFYTGEFAMIEVTDGSRLEVKNGSLIFDNYFAKANRKAKGVVAVKNDSTLTAIDVNMSNKYTGTVVYANSSSKVTLKGGEYAVQNGFALYLENQASLTLDGPYIHTTMGDGTPTQYVDGYGALYSESSGELVINDAFFKSGVQVSASQIGAFSVATHEVTINGQTLTEDIFEGTNFEAKQQNKEYYWYAWTGYSLSRTSNSSFTNPIRVISYEKKYPITVECGKATVGGVPVTEAGYGQEVTIVANTPEEGMEFVRWDTSEAVLDNSYSASATFTMPPAPVAVTAYYGKEAVKSVSVTVGEMVVGKTVNDTEITLGGGVILQGVEWREEASLLMGDYAVFKAGKFYKVNMLVYPPEGNKFGDTVTATVNGNNATVTATPQYAYIEYTFEAIPSVGYVIVYDVDGSQLGVGGKIILDTELMASQSAEFKSALEAGGVTYQWYRNGEAIEGANEAVYNFTADDASGIFYVAVNANGKINYGYNVTCYSDLYQLYLNAGGIVAGGKVPQITSATPGISIDAESMVIYEILGENSYGNPINVKNAVLIPGKNYLLVGKIIEQDDVTIAHQANVYVNGELMNDKFDTGRFFYEFTVPEADFPVYYKTNGEVGIGVTLTVDVDKMCDENATFKHAVEVQTANPTYKTVFYQWYKDGVAINSATKAEYTVKSTDKNSLIHCQVNLVDEKCGVGEQCAISNVITVINVRMPVPRDGEELIPSSKASADGVNIKLAWYSPQGNQMTEGTYEEGVEYGIFINFEAKEGLSLDFSGDRTKAYIYGVLAPEGSSSGTGIAYFTEVVASHSHEYSDDVWDSDEYAHWQPCIKPNCPNPTEEWMMYTEHKGGNATCQTKGECAICGAEYYADHDFSVPDYQYVDDMKCANYCEHCDLYIDWSYHEGGVSDCQNKAICEICHHEYGELANHNYSSEWIANANEHWNECECGDKANKAVHTDSNNDGKCDTCEYQMSTTPNTPDNPNNTPDNPNNTPDDPNEDKEGLGAGAIVGIVIGSALVAGVGGFALFWFVIKKKSFADLVAVFKKKQ